MSKNAASTGSIAECVAIAGVGLIGGSIAAALKKRGLCRRILGVGRTEQRLQAARNAGLIDALFTDVKQAAAEADLMIFCTPVDHIVAGVREAAPHCRPGTLLTDTGSVKGHICRALADSRRDTTSHHSPLTTHHSPIPFVGSHPLAGSEKSGFEHADADLFEGRLCVVTPTEESPPEAVARISEFWRRLGMRVVEKSPEEHDRLLAATSHLPHVVAAALATLLDEENREFAATGFRDTTRIAGSDAALWTAILEANRADIASRLDAFEAALCEFREAIETGDSRRLQNLLQTAKRKREALEGEDDP